MVIGDVLLPKPSLEPALAELYKPEMALKFASLEAPHVEVGVFGRPLRPRHHHHHRVAEAVVETGMIEGALALVGRAPLVGAPLAEVTFEGEAPQEEDLQEEGPQVVAQIGN